MRKIFYLPSPDKFGNYWFSVDHKIGPAIFPIKSLERDGTIKLLDGYTVFVGDDGFLKDSTGFRRAVYRTPHNALDALNRYFTEGSKSLLTR